MLKDEDTRTRRRGAPGLALPALLLVLSTAWATDNASTPDTVRLAVIGDHGAAGQQALAGTRPELGTAPRAPVSHLLQ